MEWHDLTKDMRDTPTDAGYYLVCLDIDNDYNHKVIYFDGKWWSFYPVIAWTEITEFKHIDL